jgi:hypothetical protein
MMPTHPARHEAGHLVAAYLLGLPTSSATVVPSKNALGLVRFKDSTAAFEADPVKARKLIVATLAARAACKQYGDPGLGCEADDDSVWAAARAIVGDDPANAAEVGLLVEECWSEAVELVEDHSQAVADVARHLDLFGSMKGQFLGAVVEQYVEQDKASTSAQRHREVRRKFRQWWEEQQGGGNTNDSNA